MKIINATYEILTNISKGGIRELKRIEKIGKAYYKSEDKIEDPLSSTKRFVGMLIDRGRQEILEYSTLSVKFIVDREVSHELVKHKNASFVPESTSYFNYGEDKFDNEIVFIKPLFFETNTKQYSLWYKACEKAESTYFDLLISGCTPQEARLVLPNSLKTEVAFTADYAGWRNFFNLRVAETAHPQIREVTRLLLDELKTRIPVIFDDITYDKIV